MLQENNKYFNSIKMIQSEIKVTLSEIKKNSQGTVEGMKLRIRSMIWNIRKKKKKHSIRTAKRKKK